MRLLLTLFGATFAFIFLKAFQQRNVAFNNYIAVFPTSIGMAAMEVFTVTKVAANGWTLPVVLAIGSAAGTGALAAMLLHNKLFKKDLK